MGKRAHWLIPGHEEWDTEIEERNTVVGKMVTLSKYVKEISKYTKDKRSQVSPYLRIYLQKWEEIGWI